MTGISTGPGTAFKTLDSGHDPYVYLTDWIPPASRDCWRGLEACVNEDLANAMHLIAAERGTSQVSIIGYCLGALVGVIYTASHPWHVRNLLALTMPLEMSATATLVATWLSAQTVELITALYGNCPAWVFSALSLARLGLVSGSFAPRSAAAKNAPRR